MQPGRFWRPADLSVRPIRRFSKGFLEQLAFFLNLLGGRIFGDADRLARKETPL